MPRFEALAHIVDGSRFGQERSLGTFELAIEALECLRKDGCAHGRIVNLETGKANIYKRGVPGTSCTVP